MQGYYTTPPLARGCASQFCIESCDFNISLLATCYRGLGPARVADAQTLRERCLEFRGQSKSKPGLARQPSTASRVGPCMTSCDGSRKRLMAAVFDMFEFALMLLLVAVSVSSPGRHCKCPAGSASECTSTQKCMCDPGRQFIQARTCWTNSTSQNLSRAAAGSGKA